MAASATFALKAGVWFRRGRLIMVSPDSQATACPPSGRNSTYRPVQISGASSRRTDVGKRFFKGRAQQGGVAERKAMIDREHDLPITRQAELVRISRGSVYYLPRPVPASDLTVM